VGKPGGGGRAPVAHAPRSARAGAEEGEEEERGGKEERGSGGPAGWSRGGKRKVREKPNPRLMIP